MKKLVYLFAITFLVLLISTSCKDGLKFGSKAFEPVDTVDSISYSIGMDIAQNIEKQDIEINADALTAGYKEYVEQNSFFTVEEKDAVLAVWQQEMQQKQQQEQAEQASADAEPNKKAGAEFLATNKKNEGIIETQSGLQYKVIKAGQGPSPTEHDIVIVHYSGKLLDGTVFDSSYDRGEPVEFPVNGVILGWTEALQLMNTGAIYQLFIPSDLAYGDNAAGDKIPAGSTLIFEVELISFKSAENPDQQ
ncbi:MAG: FKBP-type peptidyl-prolyl cis-trans isomerase [Bacteroidetes bacterium]|nr:FKBP-type peptidyl-prolyl cis-trans isomerase [Bacteroidota bacterium]MBL6964055.1 FKBP-type peptidyl-prolyl cis-trans isomerase [Bacteroidota bacterium]